MRPYTKCFLISVLAFFVAYSSVFFTLVLFKVTLFSSVKTDQEKFLIIKKGSSLQNIIDQMYNVNLIESPKLLKVVLKIIEKDSNFKAGEYHVKPGTSVYSAIEKIINGNTVSRQMTIPPGLTNYQIKQKLLQNSALTGEIPDDIVEGSLFADTYNFEYGDTRISLIDRMKDYTIREFEKLWLSADKTKLPFKSIQEALILASIVERESGKYDNMARIAGVFINRINKGMRLQSDPTVIYAITNGNGLLERDLNKNDVKVASLYNTYHIKGLPPTPICNPSLKAFTAVLNPIKTKELYFVADNIGGHYFSEKLGEHNIYRQTAKRNKNGK